MWKLMTAWRLRRENRDFQGSGGVSEVNRTEGFRPAFCDTETGLIALSRFASGDPAPVHVLCAVPEEWVVKRDGARHVIAVKASVVAGFLRNECFYTREEAAAAIAGLLQTAATAK